MNWPDWWWPGYLIGFAVFLLLMALLTWWLLRRGKQAVADLYEEVEQRDLDAGRNPDADPDREP